MDSEVKKIGFSRLAKFDEISEKIAKIRESARGGRICGGIEPKLIFWTLGGLCDQNESYTGLVGPFLMILYNCEVRPFSADFPEISFSSIIESTTSQRENY